MITDLSETATHRGLHLAVRPVRLAVAVEPGGDWVSRARSCLIALSATWGGVSSILLGGSDYPAWKRRMLRSHDPDYVATFIPTVLTLFPRYSDATKAEEWVKSYSNGLVRQHGIRQDQALETAKRRLEQPISDWHLTDEMVQRLEAMLPLLGRPGRPHVTLEGTPWEYVSMSHVDRSCLLYTSPSPRDRTRSR